MEVGQPPQPITWNASTEIVNGTLPLSLDGISVTVDDKPTSIYFISPRKSTPFLQPTMPLAW